MRVIDYKIHAPTVLDFLKVYLVEVLNIEIKNRTETKKKEENALLSHLKCSLAKIKARYFPNRIMHVVLSQVLDTEKISCKINFLLILAEILYFKNNKMFDEKEKFRNKVRYFAPKL